MNDKKIIKYDNLYKQTFFGILSGLINVVIFNPFDRALNLATKNSTSVFIKKYWNPLTMYQGIHHGIIQRTISYGLWYPIVDKVHISFDKLNVKNKYIDSKVLATTVASGLIGLVTSPVSATKQQYWGSDQKKGMVKFAIDMYKIGGLYAFVRGTTVTVKRDMTFGLIFGYFSLSKNKTECKSYSYKNLLFVYDNSFLIKYKNTQVFSLNYNQTSFLFDSLIATLATIASSPFNYIRIMKYSTACDVHLSSFAILKNLYKIINVECPQIIPKQIIYMFYNKFNVGWGSVRVGIGMAFSKQLYEYFKTC